MKEYLNGRTAIPLKAWQAERVKLTAEKSAFNSKYQSLKEEIKEVETISRYAEGMERSVAPPQKMQRKELDR